MKKTYFLKSLNFEIIYIFLILSLILVTYFFRIPTNVGEVGISAEVLDITDRSFYLNSTSQGFGYEKFSGNFLYPSILKLITKLTLFFNQSETSKLWNLLVMSITSIFSICSLRLLSLSAKNLFNVMTSKITSLLFLLNPYTYFYALSGGLEFYMILGVSLVFYIFSKNNNLFESEMNFKSLKKLFMVCLACIFLSSLRPSGAIFSLVVLVYLLINFLKRIMRISSFSSNSFSSILLLSISIVLTINSLFITEKYIFASINVFQETKGNFLGYPRALINEKLLVLKAGNIFSSIKYFIYNSIWKICDLISGFSDLRDTRYGFQDNKALFPFLARVFTGTFYLMPLNVLTILSLIKYFKFIIKRKIYIIFFASFLSISPSLMGMALSRYWIMFYSPFLVLVAKLIFDIFLKKEQEDILIN